MKAARQVKLEALRPKAPAKVVQAVSADETSPLVHSLPVDGNNAAPLSEEVTNASKTALSPPTIVQDLLPLGGEADHDRDSLDLSGLNDDSALSASRTLSSPAAAPRKVVSPSIDTSSMSTLLSHHRSEQDALSSELATMASRLKQNSLAFSSLLEKDKQLLSTAEEKLEGNLVGMTGTRERLKSYSKKGGVSLWFTIGSVAAVACAWFFMFALMRLL